MVIGLRAAVMIVATSLSLVPFNLARADASLTRAVARGFQVEKEVRLRNLAGKVTVTAAEGTETLLTATIHAEGETTEEAEELLNSINLKVEEKGDLVKVDIRYPLDKYRTYRYPATKRSGNWTSNATYDGERVTVTSRETSKSVTLWVDVDLSLASGVGVHIRELAGGVEVSSVSGGVDIDNGWGDISIADVRGEVNVDTGSGDVDVHRQNGAVSVDTGSGDVTLEGVEGHVEADTGSGDVGVIDVAGDVWIDTGSGDVEMTGVVGSIDVDTGSGDTRIENVRSSDVSVDTGSGRITVESPALFREPLAVDASFDCGSGDVVLVVDEEVSMLLDFSSGSGRVRSPRALADQIERIGRRSDRRYRIGGSDSRVSVDTGSGDVVLKLATR
jgi:DUF4097 and DUF4098 domain-containing protein YvlB